jgi:DNA polymerase-3 subunit epsilon
LQRLASQLHHNIDAEAENVVAYMALVDRVLEDRTIDTSEEDALVDAVTNWQLSPAQVEAAHVQYIRNLAGVAWADGVVSDVERLDLRRVARLLGMDNERLERILDLIEHQFALVCPCSTSHDRADNCLRGQRVCFTGELVSTIDGEPITRELAECLATKAGLIVASNVTKKLDILVVADPDTQSGKAKKARAYGTRILSETVFWRMAGIPVD